MKCSLNNDQIDCIQEDLLDEIKRFSDINTAMKTFLDGFVEAHTEDGITRPQRVVQVTEEAIRYIHDLYNTDRADNIGWIKEDRVNTFKKLDSFYKPFLIPKTEELSGNPILDNTVDAKKITDVLLVNYLNQPELGHVFNDENSLAIKNKLLDSLSQVSKETIKILMGRSIRTGQELATDKDVVKVDGNITESVTNIVRIAVSEVGTSGGWMNKVPNNEAFEKGNIVDTVFKYFFTREYNSYNELLATIRRATKTEYLTPEVKENLIRSSIYQAYRYAKKLNNEYYVLSGDDINLPNKRLFYNGVNGVFDLLLIHKKDKSAKVVEIKSTSSEEKDTYNEILLEDKRKEYEEQASFYNYIIKNLIGTEMLSPEIELIQIDSFGNVKNGYTEMIDPVSDEELIKKTDNLISAINRNIQVVNKQPVRIRTILDLASRVAKDRQSGEKDITLDQIFADEELSTSESLEEALEKLKKRFPESIFEDRIVPFIEQGIGGRFYASAILLAKNSNKGVEDHESWHRFSQLYLTKGEKMDLYTSIRNSNITFKTRDNRLVNTLFASLLDIEEYLAEEFRKYAQSPKDYKPAISENKSLLQKIFDAIWNLLSKLLNLSTLDQAKLIRTFKDLDQGSFDRSNFSFDNILFESANSLFKDNNGNTILEDDRTRVLTKFISNSLIQDLLHNKELVSEYLIGDGIRNRFKDRVLRSMIDNMVVLQNMNAEGNNRKEWGIAHKDILVYLNQILSLNDDTDIQLLTSIYGKVINNLDLDNEQELYTKEESEYLGRFNKYYFSTFLFQTPFKSVEKALELNNINPLTFTDVTDEEYEEVSAAENEELILFKSDKEVLPSELTSAEFKDFLLGFPNLKTDEFGANYIISYDKFKETGKFEVGGNVLVDHSKDNLDPTVVHAKLLSIFNGSLLQAEYKARMNDRNTAVVFPQIVLFKYKLEKLRERISEIDTITNPTQRDRIKRNMLSNLYSEMIEKTRYYQYDLLTQITDNSEIEKLIAGESSNQYKNNRLQINYQGHITNQVNDMLRGFQLLKDKDAIDGYTALKKLVYGEEVTKDVYNSKTGVRFFNKNITELDTVGNFKTHIDFLESVGIFLTDQAKNPAYFEQNILEAANIIFRSIQYKNADNDKVNDNIKNRSKRKSIAAHSEDLKEYFNEYENPSTPSDRKRAIENIFDTFLTDYFTAAPLDRMLSLSNSTTKWMTSKDKAYSALYPVLLRIAVADAKFRNTERGMSISIGDNTENPSTKDSQLTLKVQQINGLIRDKSRTLENEAVNFYTNPFLQYTLHYKNQVKSDIGGVKIGKVSNSTYKAARNNQYEDTSVSQLSANERAVNGYLQFLADSVNNKQEFRVALHNMEASDSVFYLTLDRLPHSDITNISERLPEGVVLDSKAFAQMFDYFKLFSVKFIQDGGSLSFFDDLLLDEDNNKGIAKDRHGKNLLTEWKALIKNIPLDLNIKTNLDRVAANNSRIVQDIRAIFNNYIKNSANDFRDILTNVHGELSLKLNDASVILEGFDTKSNEVNYTDVVSYTVFDIFGAIEESVFYFGDVTYYKDPSKRRKVINNTGTSAHLTEEQLEVMRGDFKTSFKSILSEFNISLLNDDIFTKKEENVNRFLILKDAFRETEINALEVELKAQGQSADLSKVEDFKGLKHSRDGDALMSLDLLKRLFKKDNKFGENEVKEYERQMAHLKLWLVYTFDKRYEGIKDKLDFMNEAMKSKELARLVKIVRQKEHAKFTKQKIAVTGPMRGSGVFYPQALFFKPAITPLLPTQFLQFHPRKLKGDSATFSKTQKTALLFLKTINGEIDYIIDESAAKGYIPTDLLIDTNNKNAFRGLHTKTGEHSAMWLKEQINQTKDSTVSLLGTQRLNQMSNMAVDAISESDKLELYKELDIIKANIDHIIESNKDRLFKDIGIDDNNIDQDVFRRYIAKALKRTGRVSLQHIQDILHKTAKGYTYDLTYSKVNKDIQSIIGGLLDESIRGFRTPGVFNINASEEMLGLFDHIDKLKTHRVIKTGGKKTITHAEVIISFSEQYHLPLFNLKYKDKKGNITTINEERKGLSVIDKIDLLNELLDNPTFVKDNISSLELTFSRIPFSNNNFNAHGVYRAFLYPELSGLFCVPLENGYRVGLDNDNDKMPIQLKKLDKNTGLPISIPNNKSQNDYYREFLRLREEYTENPDSSSDSELNRLLAENEEFNQIKQEIYNILLRDNATNDVDMDDDFIIVNGEFLYTFDDDHVFNTRYSNLAALRKLDPDFKDDSEMGNLLEDANDILLELSKGTGNPILALKQAMDEAKYNYENYKYARYNEVLSSEINMLSNISNLKLTLMTDSLHLLEETVIAVEKEILPASEKYTLSNNLGKESKEEKKTDYARFMTPAEDYVNIKNKKDRMILGPIIKFVSGLSQLVDKGAVINSTWISGSKTKIKSQSSKGLVTVTVPLHLGGSEAVGKPFSLRDKNKKLKTLILSDSASSYLDLFKNPYTAAATGISFYNSKIFTGMIALGIDEKTIYSFLKSPVVRTINEVSKQYRSEFKNRLSYIIAESNLSLPVGDRFNINHRKDNGYELIQAMPDPIGILNEELNNNRNIDLAAEMKMLSIDFYKEIGYNNLNIDSLSIFLSKHPEYAPTVKLLIAYYGVMHRWGNDLYNYYIVDNPLSTSLTDATLTYNRSQNKRSREFINMLSFPDNTKSISDLFENDQLVGSIYGNTINASLLESYTTRIQETVLTKAFKTGVEKDRMLNTLRNQWFEFMYKKFYKYNGVSIPDYFENDFYTTDDTKETMHQSLGRLVQKYPILAEIEFVRRLNTKEAITMTDFDDDQDAIHRKITNRNNSILNYLKFDSKGMSNSVIIEEDNMRDQFQRLINFNPHDWGSVFQTKKALDFYNNPIVIKEISNFFDLLQYYSLAVLDPWSVSRQSISKFIPTNTIYKIMEETFKNFNELSRSEKDLEVTDFLDKFVMFNPLIFNTEKRSTYDRFGVLKPYEVTAYTEIIEITNTFTVSPANAAPVNINKPECK